MKINKVQIRNLQIEDYDQLAQSFTRVYSDGSDVFWTHKQIEKLIRICRLKIMTSWHNRLRAFIQTEAMCSGRTNK